MSFPVSDSFLADYQSITTGWGAIELGGWTMVSIVGEDRARLVHNMCTNDICRLSPGEGCETFFADVKGKIVAHGFVLVAEDQLLFLTVPQQASVIIKHLDRYIIREDVQLLDNSDKYGLLVLCGTEVPFILRDRLGVDSVGWQTPLQNTTCNFQDIELLLVGFNALWPEAFLLRYPQGEKERLLSSLDQREGAPAVWKTLRVESGLPLLGVDFGPSNLPQELNRDARAISFNKGCYLGQETIARIDALGHVNQQLVSLQFSENTLPEPGDKVFVAEKEVGKITSAVWSPRLEAPLALAMVRRGFNALGSELQCERGRAIVIPFPAFQRS
ncbi:MAG: folate-binding protein YgfZ [Planctomycetales bacterium]|nr:folate-binding protein YgfZ [Planctomycetales bacterium]